MTQLDDNPQLSTASADIAVLLESIAVLQRRNEALQKERNGEKLRADHLENENVSLSEKADALQQQTRALRQQTERQEILIGRFKFELAYLRRLRFGKSAESLNPAQRELFTEDAESNLSELQAEMDEITPPVKSRRAHPGRQTLPANLPRVEVRHEAESCTCGHCGGELSVLREDITERLDVVPATFTVVRHIRPQMVCRPCERITAAPAPTSVIAGGMAEAGLLAQVLISKYLDHLPLYRQEQIAARQGVHLPRSTLADWIGRCSFALRPLHQRLTELMRQRRVMHADETPIRQLDPGKGKTRQSYLWVYRSNDLDPDEGPPIAVFEYHLDRKGAHARNFLKDWSGDLVVDDYAGYKHLFRNDDAQQSTVCEVGCWAHVRRKFVDLQQHGNAVAMEALQRIARLYRIELRARRLHYSIEQRQQIRQLAQRELQAMKPWLDAQRLRTAPGSALAKALDYTLKRWPSLIRYAGTGHLPIDNNPVENVIRPVAVGKKNWLFTGSEQGGKRAEVIETLLLTAKLNGIEPHAWLSDVLEKLPTWPNSRLDELLPFAKSGDT